MSNPIALIIGGSGMAGQSAIQAFQEDRSKSGRAWKIIATTSGESEVSGSDRTLKGIALEDPKEAVQKVLKELQTESSKVDTLIYTPARSNLGYPVSETPEKDIVSGLKFCLDPMVELEQKLQPRLTIGYSAYYYLPHLLMFYGSMGFIKKKMEEWALEKPDSRKIIRAGTFFSQSVRGITLILQRLAKSTPHTDLKNLVEEQKNSGKKFPEFFLDYVKQKEQESFGSKFPSQPYRITEPEDLKNALLRILNGEKEPIVSLVGAWVWTESKLPEMPAFLKSR
ncbi:hypothetical protein CH373_03995 [Leptospira perolatii]|uniref:Short-chain dehydrogenase n=1 Tax=Leptospira perolatii TaxID=2023191 RepID=A0A2M9ZPZ7_9LEPT|nr:hypothetical protein [Leptospira perolatii]PJZ69036.1 hypothetical protein CH360_13335 [Leptospira perolatii]PJZ74095.1 hypothetical protein CH373_03995 [Leptospira perolatii]